MPANMPDKNSPFLLMFFSLKTIAPIEKATITPPRLIAEITEMRASVWLSALKYMKSAMTNVIPIKGIDHLKTNFVVV